MTTITKMRLKGFKSFAKPLDLEFGNGFNCILGPNGSGKSTKYDTRVLLSSGEIVKIGDLVEKKFKNTPLKINMDDGAFVVDNDEDLKVYSLDPQTMCAIPKKINAFIRREGEPFLYELETKTGKKITTTGCHPVMVFRDNKIVSERIENLHKGERIASPRIINLPEKEIMLSLGNATITKDHYELLYKKTFLKIKKYLDNNFSRLLGYLVGDGCLIENQRTSFTNADQEVIDDYSSIVKGMNIDIKVRERKGTKAKEIYAHSSNLTNFLINLFRNKYKKEKKHIPQEILFAKKEYLASFLSALFDCDATVSKTTPALEYTTMSKTLADQVQFALLRFGIVARQVTKLKYATNTKEKKKKPYYDICIEGKEDLVKLNHHLVLLCSHKKRQLCRHIQKEVKTNPNIDLLPKEVNQVIRKCIKVLGIPVKPWRKEYPRLAAYMENRCHPTREGVIKILDVCYEKFRIMHNVQEELECEQGFLCDAMRVIGSSTIEAAQAIGITRHALVDTWEQEQVMGKQKHIENFYIFIKTELQTRLQKAQYLIQILENLAASDIFWDEIVSIKKVKGEKYVYDLSIPGTHNFVANNLFVHNSNIMDALCFVLGKISAKSMRAEKSANLIFNGGKVGSPMKEAEVSIFFDNKDKEFPIEDKEVKVSRVVKKTGQSVYKINDDVRTRQQILEMLSTAKIDPDGHNIILQGDIVRFMEMKTEERREIIEEIAGIAVYEDRKTKAMNELTKVDGRLNEATIILTEREAYLRELKKERDQAVKYRDLEKNIKGNKATHLHIQISEKEKKKGEIEKRIEKNNADVDRINKKIEETKDKIVKKKKELENISKNIEEKGEKESIELQKSLESVKTDIVRNNERLNVCKNEINKVKERKKQLEASLQDIQNTIKSLKESKKELKEKEGSLKGKEGKVLQDIKKFKEKYNVSDSGSDLDKVEKEIDDVTGEIEETQKEKEELLQRKFRLDVQINNLDEKINNFMKLGKGVNLDKIKKDLEKTSIELHKSLDEDSFLASQLGDVREDIRKAEEQLFVLQARDAGRKSSVMDNSAIKKILSLKNPNVYGTVSQLGTVDKKYSLALSVAAGSRMNNIVVKDDKIAADCIKILKRDKLGTATFLPLNKIKARQAPSIKGRGVIGNALNLVSFDNRFKNVFSYVFGNAVVVDNIETARRIGIGKARMVTLEGDITEVSGAMVGGYRYRGNRVGFQEKQDIGDLGKLGKDIDKFSKIKNVLERRREENEEKIERLRKGRSLLEGEIIKIEKSFGSVDLDKLRKERDRLKEDEAYPHIKEVEKDIEDKIKELEVLRKDREKIRKDSKGLKHPEVLLELDRLESRRQKLREEIVSLGTEIKNIDVQIENIYNPEIEKTTQIIKQHDKETQDFVKEAKELENLLKIRNKDLKDKEGKEARFKKDYKDLFVKRNKINEEVQKLEASISVEDMKIKNISGRINDISINRAKIVGELEGLNKEFEEFRGVALRRSVSLEKLKDEIRDFERLLDRMGNVNLRALEVYDNIKKEYEELIKKVDKLRGEKDDILQMIYEIETKKKDMFLKSFNDLSKNFTKIFSSLSSKGEAFLYLENQEDPLSEGVDIRVKIVGNKFLDIKSLSGGEKTLAALSFIFAIQEYQPGSFYILDEVDAALDKTNSVMLSKLISKYSDRAQYIIISHNDSVITEADQIYGVSMQQNGISKIVSLKI